MITKLEQLPQDTLSNILSRLPQDILCNILSRLPARELLKCKFVSESWFNLITDPYFINKYYVFYNNLIYSQNQKEHLWVIRTLFNNSGVKIDFPLMFWNLDDPKKHVSSSPLNLPHVNNRDKTCWGEILGSCNGLYFIQGFPNNLIINPSLKQCHVLPLRQYSITCSKETYLESEFAGFGFDHKTNDYKVVLLQDVWLKKANGEREKGYWIALLYSLNSHSWRKFNAEDLPLPFEISHESSAVYTFMNSCCHWWGYVDKDGGGIEKFVLAFNMVDETFRKIKVPKIEYSCFSGECYKTLAPFNESNTIGVIVYPIRGIGVDKCFDVWVMKNYCDEESWIKLYSAGPVPMDSKFVGFYGINGFLWKDNDGRLVLYDSENDKMMDLQVYGKPEIRVVRYMESIVSLRRPVKKNYN
ncbi:F-box protein At5g49610-like [Vicia villosa]|uniref:F-box protein At5g49610-like n=1 Tax=Vicia villosa TaxID=3911 RepID=UPI00273AEAE9|nr:F-box protein At5g49610-like [Vicia villosa]